MALVSSIGLISGISTTNVNAQSNLNNSISSNTIKPYSVGTVTTGDGVRLRSTPSLSGKILTTLSKGTYVMFDGNYQPVYADGHTWHKVYIGNNLGQSGWISEMYLDMEMIII
ncbi:MAG: SH3 domain-containing protein [Clostridium sp.]